MEGAPLVLSAFVCTAACLAAHVRRRDRRRTVKELTINGYLSHRTLPSDPLLQLIGRVPFGIILKHAS